MIVTVNPDIKQIKKNMLENEEPQTYFVTPLPAVKICYLFSITMLNALL